MESEYASSGLVCRDGASVTQWMKVAAGFLVSWSVLYAGTVASAQSYPTRPIRVIVPFGTGGTTDILARLLAPVFQRRTGQPVIVDNRAGASGLIGAEIAARSAPDGHTLLLSTASLTINITLYSGRMKFDPLTDLVPIGRLASVPLVLAVHPSVPANSVSELVALARRKPGFLNAGMVPGTSSHLTAEMFRQRVGVRTLDVPFKGGGQAVVALMSGELDYLMVPGPAALAAARSGKVRVLAVTAAKPSAAFPGVLPLTTFYPGLEADNWYAMWFPANVPGVMVAYVNQLIGSALQDGKIRTFMLREGMDPVGSTPAELDAQVKREISRYAVVIRKGNIRLE